MRSASYRLLALAAMGFLLLGVSAASAAFDAEPAQSSGGHQLTAVKDGDEVVVCEEGKILALDEVTGTEVCASLQIGIGYSPNPVPYGGSATITVTVTPATDCWDSAGRGGYGGFSFTTGALYSSFPYTAYCAGAGTESTTLNINVNPPGSDPPPPPPPSGGNIPAVTSAPTISGSPEVGKTLTANRGSWTNDPTSYNYAWRRSGDLQQLGTASTLALTSAHAGYQIRVDVQACNGTGCSSWSSSGWTAAVAQQPVTSVDSDGDGVSDSKDNCPGYFSRDNKCDAEAVSGDAEVGNRSLTGLNQSCASYWRSRTAKNLLGKVLIRLKVTANWCWSSNLITSVDIRVIPEVVWFCCWFDRGQVQYDVRNTNTDAKSYTNWGKSSFNVFVQYKFEACMPKGVGCVQQKLPWVEINLYHGGRYSGSGGGT